jgi:hypothetical protein
VFAKNNFGRDVFPATNTTTFDDIVTGKIDDPETFAFAKLAVEQAVRYGPGARNVDASRTVRSTNQMMQGESNVGSERDFRLYPTPLKVIHGETRGVLPQMVAKPPFPKGGMRDSRNWDSQSLAKLQQARADIAQVVEHRNNTDMVVGVDEAELPTAQSDAATQQAGVLGQQAVTLPSNLPPDVRHFFLRGADPKLDRQRPTWANPGETPFRTYGPFLNGGGGGIRSRELYIEFYRGNR